MKNAIRDAPITAYPFQVELQVRLTDLDFARHINNAAMAAFHEEVRVRFHIEYFGADAVFNRPAGGGLVAHVSIDYLREALYGAPLTGCAAIERLGRSSYTVAQSIFQGNRCVSEARCVIAQREGGQAAPLTSDLRKRLESLSLVL